MKRSDFAFANDVRAAIELRTPRTYRLLVRSIAALLLVLIVWAHFAIIDEVTRGSSRVIPSRQTQVVQTLEGGIVEAINVLEGAIVRKGDVLMRIDDTNFAAQFGEVRERRAALAARVARLSAESAGQPLAFPADIDKDFARLAASEAALFEARQRKLEQDIEVLGQQESQKARELEEATAQSRRLQSTLALLEREIEITRRLYKKQVVPEIEMLRTERQLAEANGQAEVVKATIARIEGAILEARARRDSATSTFRAAAQEELVRARGDLAVAEETIKSAQDRVRRTDLRSPVHGIVNKINVTTVGAVVQPAQSLIEIVPLDDTLLVEAQVRPADIAFIRPGQAAVVKISAYDSTIYGALHGKVERIGADTQTTQQGETYYRVVVRTETNTLSLQGQPLPIIPGMVGTVEVLTGRKSVLSYLLRPLNKVFSEALREH